MTPFVAALGTCIGLVAGLLGAGGSILTVLLLVYVIRLDIGVAVATSLVVVAAMSLAALVPYVRARAVSWRAALSFGIASMIGAYAGGHVSKLVPERMLLGIFLGAMVAAASAMLCPRAPSEATSTAMRWNHVVIMVTAGVLVGGLTGLVGLAGGFAVVPVLVVFGRAPVRKAIGSSILVMSMNTLAGLAGHFPHPAIDWRLAGYLGVAECVGSFTGARLAPHVSAKALRRAFAALMLLGAASLMVRTWIL